MERVRIKKFINQGSNLWTIEVYSNLYKQWISVNEIFSDADRALERIRNHYLLQLPISNPDEKILAEFFGGVQVYFNSEHGS